MPIIPPSPAPSTPQGATGGTWINNGSATSGTVSALDYAYYTQTSEWDYVRKPRYVDSNKGTGDLDLNQASAVQPVYSTVLHVNAKFKSSCKKIKQLPGGGPYTQQQKFEIYSIATDQYGTSYGTIPDASDGIIFGPRGKVFTSQPWVWQLPWDDARDVEYDIVTVGTSNGLAFSGYDGSQEAKWKTGNNLADQFSFYINEYGSFPQWGSLAYHSERHSASDTYQIYGGGYALSSEIGFSSSALGIQRMEQFIEDNVDMGLKGGAWNSWSRRYVIPLPIASDGYASPVEADRVVVDPYYSTSRHDYS
tara:strand:- start:876 stop:1796 length:921 start_codon:yes stop_codon:yes gene_type:complete